MPSSGETKAAQARQRRHRDAAEGDRLRTEVERLTSVVADRDAKIERLTAALAQVSADRAGGVGSPAATSDGQPEPGPLARSVEDLDLGSCEQCHRLARSVRLLDEKAMWAQRTIDAETQAHAATRTQLAGELDRRAARIDKLEQKIKRLTNPFGGIYGEW